MNTAATPAERLTKSRERLRLALNGSPPAPDDPDAAQQAAHAAAPWWEKIAALPGAAIVIEAAQQWWARHPLRANILLAFSATQAVVQPIAQRHPVALVAAAFVFGGLLAWYRPLGWLLKPALFAGLLPQLLVASLNARPQRPPTP
jgi:hypothetical protein